MTISKETLAAVQAMRTGSKQHDDARDAGLPTEIPTVTRLNDLSYGPEKPWQLLDVSRPKTAKQSLPVIINIHGGGWVYGTKEIYQFYCLTLAKAGFAVVNFNYRLGPDVQFPAELDDVNRVMHWVVDHADQYGFDLRNVFVVGDSAGGQMAEQYLAILTNADYRQQFGYQRPELTVRAAALNCGAYFLLEPGMLTGAPAAYFTPETVEKNRSLLQTEKYLTTELPPLFIMTANHDFLHDNAVRLDGYLMAKRIQHELHIYGNDQSPREHVFHIDQRDAIGQQCNQDELAFFKRYLQA